ncbi:MAG: hypothetical protein IKP62_09125 [Salinivirgaceae bacterium]|nr:hypothetical protein [Salinivirgaceae bacterium]
MSEYMNNNNFQDESTEYVTAGGSKGGISTFAIVLCSIALLMVIALVVFKVVQNNNGKEVVIENTSNPKFNIGTWTEDEKNASYTYIDDMYSLWPGEVGKTRQDSLKHIILKAFIVSKDSVVLSEFMERRYRDNVPHLTVFGNEIKLNPYLQKGSCEYIRIYPLDSYNNLILCTLDVVGRGSDKKYYSQPLTLMINIETKECKVVGRGYCIDGSNGHNIAIFDDEYFCFLDYYMDSQEFIYKYYDLYGYYVGWTPSVSLEYTATNKKFYYTTPMETTNWDWTFTYGNDKYGRPVSMEKSKEKYNIKYTKTGYHITGYDDKGRKTADYEQNNENDFIDLRTWDLQFNRWGRLTKYSYDSKGVLDTRTYYNNSQSYYLKENQRYNGTFYCVGIYANSGEFVDDVLIDVDDYWGESIIYRNDPRTGRKTEIATLPSSKTKKWLLDYLYKLN